MRIQVLMLIIIFIIASCSNTSHKDKGQYQNSYKEDAKTINSVDMEEDTDHNTEEYDKIEELGFRQVIDYPQSTFSIDVDAASYSNVRRFISQGEKPPPDAVRIEELINYFSYDYKNPTGEHPFSINTEVADCPWNKDRKLIHIGIQGRKIAAEQLPSSNLVFLLDVSGSMDEHNKLPLLKSSLKMLLENLNKRDRVAVVVYAGAAGLVLPSTSCDEKDKIMDAINDLEAGGSTAGGEGIRLAYKVAKDNFIQNGNNRVILATDGDFNIGESSDGAMVRLIEDKRKDGIFLSVLGFGMGNYKDSKMEKISNAGNGNYAYIDNLFEAKKVLVSEIGGTLVAIAKDVKIQIEFNPAKIIEYRLIGYENRMLHNEDFDDDTKDAGELGAGHTVTAIYEVTLNKSGKTKLSGKELKYQKSTVKSEAYKADEICSIKFRYKKPDGEKSILLENVIKNNNKSLDESSDNFKFSAAVAEWGLLLRESKFKSDASFENVVKLAKASKGDDTEGYRIEFIKLAEATGQLYK